MADDDVGRALPPTADRDQMGHESTPALRATKRRWITPQLTKHESLTVLTRQQYDPATGQPLDPNAPPPELAGDIGGSGCVFC